MRLFGKRQRFRLARESFAGHESVESGDRESELGFTCGKIRRGRPSACLRHFLRTGGSSPCARSRARPFRYPARKIGRILLAAGGSLCYEKIGGPLKILKST